MRFALALIMAIASAPALAQSATAPANWPDRPLRMIVPLPAGSAVDVIARLISQRLSVRLGQPVIVENRAGASGVIGSDAVAKAAPDGLTLGMATSTTHMTAPVLNAKLPYDPVKDFAPVAVVGVSPYVVVVNPKVPASTVAELIALAKAKPRTLSYSSVGNASQAHLAGELFAAMAGVELNHIPYKTSTHAVIDLTEGRIDMQFGILGTSLALIREGKLRALAVTTEQRIEELPDVPTMIEAGLPGYDVSLLFAVVMPAGTPKPDRGAAQSRDQRVHGHARGEARAGGAGDPRHLRHAGSAPRAHRQGNRALARHRPEGRHQAGVTAARDQISAGAAQRRPLKTIRRADHAARWFALDHDGARRGRRTGEHDGGFDILPRRGGFEQSRVDLVVRQPHQRGGDFGLLVEFLGQALGGGDRLLKRRRFLPNTAGTVLGLPGLIVVFAHESSLFQAIPVATLPQMVRCSKSIVRRDNGLVMARSEAAPHQGSDRV